MAKTTVVKLVTRLVIVMSIDEMAKEPGKKGMWRLNVADAENGETFSISDDTGHDSPRHQAWKAVPAMSTAIIPVKLAGGFLNLDCMPTPSVIQTRGTRKLAIGTWKKTDWSKDENGKWTKGGVDNSTSTPATGREDKDY